MLFIEDVYRSLFVGLFYRFLFIQIGPFCIFLIFVCCASRTSIGLFSWVSFMRFFSYVLVSSIVLFSHAYIVHIEDGYRTLCVGLFYMFHFMRMGLFCRSLFVCNVTQHMGCRHIVPI